MYFLSVKWITRVSIHVPTRGTTIRRDFFPADRVFQSTFPRGERRVCTGIISYTHGFNPRSHEGNDCNLIKFHIIHDMFQSTFPRGERLDPVYFAATSLDVSIHVPTRGTTGVKQEFTRDAVVSIHVPTRGTTLLQKKIPILLMGFNPRSHEGNDEKAAAVGKSEAEFQSTFPRGERHHRRKDDIQPRGFNPRSHEGNDGALVCIPEKKGVSIHVPTRGTTLNDVLSDAYSIVSIHVPTRGTTCPTNNHRAPDTVSIHVPTRGTTMYRLPPELSKNVSIHVPTRGTTWQRISQKESIRGFQSTFPRGERRDSKQQKLATSTFQSTFPRGERHAERIKEDYENASFNPRSHEGNDRSGRIPPILSNKFQSTFPRGERQIIKEYCHRRQQFQSTFPRGERRYLLSVPQSCKLFQSTFPRGERPGTKTDRYGKKVVSIHVPTRGTTRKSLHNSGRNRGFNPRSHEGNDVCQFCYLF